MTSLVKVLVQGPASCSGLLSPSTLKIAMERTSDVEEETQKSDLARLLACCVTLAK